LSVSAVIVGGRIAALVRVLSEKSADPEMGPSRALRDRHRGVDLSALGRAFRARRSPVAVSCFTCRPVLPAPFAIGVMPRVRSGGGVRWGSGTGSPASRRRITQEMRRRDVGCPVWRRTLSSPCPVKRSEVNSRRSAALRGLRLWVVTERAAHLQIGHLGVSLTR